MDLSRLQGLLTKKGIRLGDPKFNGIADYGFNSIRYYMLRNERRKNGKCRVNGF